MKIVRHLRIFNSGNRVRQPRVAGLYTKISHPVMTDLKVTTGDNVKLTEMYPPRLPDLFHGQLPEDIMARYTNKRSVTAPLPKKL